MLTNNVKKQNLKNKKYLIQYTKVSIFYSKDLPQSPHVDGWSSNDIGKPHAKGRTAV